MGLTVLLANAIFSLGLAKILSEYLISAFRLNLFSSTEIVDFMTPGNQLLKTGDIVSFSIFIFLIIAAFVYQKISKTVINSKRLSIYYLVLSVLFYIQSYFGVHSGSALILFFLAVQVSAFLAVRLKQKPVPFDWLILANGLLAGFGLILISQHFTYSFLFTVSILLFCSFAYHFLPRSVSTNPSHLLLFTTILSPLNIYFVAALVVVVALLSIFFKPSKSFYSRAKGFYIPLFLVLILYNPNYRFGAFDTVEEGFWVGWLKRLDDGQVLYRDVMVYHPPLIAWLLKLFTDIVGKSISDIRLFFHLFRLIGLIIIYFSISSCVRSKTFAAALTLIVAALCSISFVYNNVEIRLALGLLPLVFLGKVDTRRPAYIFAAGAAAAVALFTSIESGLAAAIAVGLSILAIPSKPLKHLFWLSLGFLVPALVILLILFSKQALPEFFNQTVYYANMFSKGYFNVPIPGVISSNLVDTSQIFKIFGSEVFLWHFFMIILGVSLVSVLHSIFDRRLNLIHAYLLAFTLVLFRSTLGRSDYYHLLFALIPGLILFTSIIASKSIPLAKIFFGFLILYVLLVRGEAFQFSFFSPLVTKLQTYGRYPGTYRQYQNRIMDIWVEQGTKTETLDGLVAAISAKPVQTKIFAYPWMPEIYSLTGRSNATSVDTPYAFITADHQRRMAFELCAHPDTLIVYRPNFAFGNLTPSNLKIINDFIRQNYDLESELGEYQLLKPSGLLAQNCRLLLVDN